MTLDKSDTEAKMEVMVTLGVPYTEEDIANAQTDMLAQGTQIEKNLYTDPDFAEAYEADKKAGGEDFVEMRNREIVALIAYLQRLGTDIKVKEKQKQQSKLKRHVKIRKKSFGQYCRCRNIPNPIITYILWFFCSLFWWVITAKKDYIKTVSNIPLDNQNDTTL